jgi:hypothetical protein
MRVILDESKRSSGPDVTGVGGRDFMDEKHGLNISLSRLRPMSRYRDEGSLKNSINMISYSTTCDRVLFFRERMLDVNLPDVRHIARERYKVFAGRRRNPNVQYLTSDQYT